MDDLSKKSKEELLSDLETVNKFIQGHNNFLQEAGDYFIEKGEVWLIDSIHKKRAADLINDKTGLPRYTQKSLKHIKNELIRRSKLIQRQNLLKLEIKKRELGSDYFDYEEKPDFKNEFNETKTLREFLLRLREYDSYSYYLIDKIEFTPERIDEKKYVVWISLFTKTGKSTAPNLSTNTLGFPFTLSELNAVGIEPPLPLKEYLKVYIMRIPDSEISDEAKSIRKQLIDSGGTYTVELDNIHYYCVVEKTPEYANYYLFQPELYFNFLDSLKKSFLSLCNEINDEEYIRLFITLNEWKRKYQSTSTQKIVEYFQEIEGIFQSWYFERKLPAPDFLKYTLALRKKTLSVISQIVALKTKLKTLNSELEVIESHFEKDIIELPDDFSQQVRAKQNEINSVEVELKKNELNLWGLYASNEDGLYWKSEQMELDYRKYKINDDLLFEQQYNKYYNKSADRIKQKIKEFAERQGIEVNHRIIDEILLEVLGDRFENEDQFFEESINPSLKESNTEKTITDVITKTFNIKETAPKMDKIEFATPRANRDDRIIELSHIISHLEIQKIEQSYNNLDIAHIEKQLKVYNAELNELQLNFMGDFLLLSNIREVTMNKLELLINTLGLTYLDESNYHSFKLSLIEECSGMIYNFITNNKLEKTKNNNELQSVIENQITKLIPVLLKKYELPANSLIETSYTTNPEKELKPIPKKGLKKLAMEICEKLIKENRITDIIVETKRDQSLSKLICDEIAFDYTISAENKSTVHDYFRKFELQLKRVKGKIVILDNYKRKTKKG